MAHIWIHCRSLQTTSITLILWLRATLLWLLSLPQCPCRPAYSRAPEKENKAWPLASVLFPHFHYKSQHPKNARQNRLWCRHWQNFQNKTANIQNSVHKKSKNLKWVFLVHHMSFISNSHIYLLGPVISFLKEHLSWFWHWIFICFFQCSMCHF